MMGRITITKRYYITAFLMICIFFIAITYRTSDVQKIIPLGFNLHVYSSDANSNTSRQEPNALLNRIANGEIDQGNPELITYLRTLILPPSEEPYNIETQLKDTSMGQAAMVNKILKEKKNGFFIECGALDGETRSNSYFFERYLNWEGVLIEGDPSNFELLRNKHRKAYSTNVCLSTRNTPMKVVFKQSFNIGKIVSDFRSSSISTGYVSVQCFPIFSILLALNRTEVDYFSLDVEGAELDVLKTIPFENVNIKVLSVEYFHDTDGESGIKEFMESKGYISYGKVTHPQNLANDIIFVKKELA